jgi:hypothetical protein
LIKPRQSPDHLPHMFPQRERQSHVTSQCS